AAPAASGCREPCRSVPSFRDSGSPAGTGYSPRAERRSRSSTSSPRTYARCCRSQRWRTASASWGSSLPACPATPSTTSCGVTTRAGARSSAGTTCGRIDSAREARLGNAADSEAGDAEKAPREELRLRFPREPAVRRRVLHARHRGHVDLVELLPAEDDAGDVPHGHADAPLDAPVGRIAHEVARDQLRVPHAALGIDGRAVGDPGIVLERGEKPLVDGRAGREVVVVGPDLALEGVGEVERLVVGAPARTVGADDAVIDQGHGEIEIEAPQRADLQLLLVVHAACEEATAPVALAVVQARARVFGIDERYGFELAALEIEEVEAVVEREHRAAFLAQRERPDVALERPALGLAALRIEPPDRGFADAPARPVNPV